jgi:hypothetical protein
VTRLGLLAAPPADFIFKPAMATGGALAIVLGPIIGVGSSRGTSVLISMVGSIIVITTLIAVGIPQLRGVEIDLPDYDPAMQAAPNCNSSPEKMVTG